jgi:hypothetical protein
MRSWAALTILLAAVLPAAAADAPQVAVGQDPLTRQILRSAARPNGGVQSFTAVQGANGARVVIPLVDGNSGSALGGTPASGDSAGALKPLSPAAGLVPKEAPASSPRERVKASDKQLRHVDSQKRWER